MVELVIYPAVEALIIDYLGGKLTAMGDSAVVAGKVLNPRPDRFVRVDLAGGGGDRVVLSSRWVIAQCWDLTEPAAAALAERCYAILTAAQRDPDIPSVRNVVTVGGPASFPDPDTALPRYQFTLSVDLRGIVQ